MTLYEIDTAITELLNNVDEETGEILFSMDELEQLEMMVVDKCENIALYIKNLVAQAKAIRDEEQALAKRRRIAENRTNHLKQYLLFYLDKTSQSKMETTRAVISTRKSKQVEITDETLIPEEYKSYEVKISKKAIGDAIKNGEAVEGATIIENVNLQIR